jgi:c-di-GMP-binding flagellar brake protein YcgR
MKLSAEQFAELASTFGAQGSPIKHDRRRANRTDLRAKMRVTPVVSGQHLEPMEVMACDFSARGFAFLNPTAISRGMQFITRLPRRSGGQVEFLCTVVHCEEVGKNAYRIGAEFTCTLHPAATHTAADEQREMQRIRESMMK